MKKLFLAIFLILLSLFVLYGIFPQKENSRTTIKFSSWGSRTEYAILKEVIADYEKNNPNVKIEFIHVPEDYFRKLHLLYASKTEPDVVFLNNTYAPLYIKSNLLEDLSEFVDEKEFYESSVDCFKDGGKLYAVPRDISNLVLFVNKNIVKNPENIKTVDDLRKYAKKYTNSEHFGLNYEKNPLFWLYYLNYFNGGILSDDGKQVIFNSPESRKGLQLYVDMINKDKSIPHEWQVSSMTSAQAFICGKTALYLSGRWVVPKFRETLNFDWDIIPFPASENSKTLTDASGWAVSKSSKHKKEAVDFVKYMSSKKVSEKFTETGLITPARVDVAHSPIFLASNQKPKNSKVFIDILENSKPTPVNSNYAKITDDVTKAVLPVFNGNKTTDDIFTDKFILKLQKYCDKSMQ